MAPSAPVKQNRPAENGKHSNGCCATSGRNRQSSETRVAVVGGGLVGSMAACMLARRGYHVDLYEMREDPRQAEHVPGKSINLALSERGRSALRLLGLEHQILDQYSIKMYGRMIHNRDGSKRSIPYGTRPDQCILSVSRRFLNELLITEAERYSKQVSVHFQHKLLAANLKQGLMTFESATTDKAADVAPSGLESGTSGSVRIDRKADVILGCDGAYSAVRRHMIKLLLLDYSQKYIEHGYMELNIPATESGDFAMESNHLHIWPRGEFMMIALPNLDKSFTVTLFMPFKIFDDINDETKLIRFFQDNFADSIPLLTKEGLIKTFMGNRASPLISIKCKPYHYEDKVLLMGDAAHAMVPFYGQGMNCGFEDCFELDRLLDRYGNDRLGSVLARFTEIRVDNCHAIIDLAMYNYVEMRDLVNKRTFLWRKRFDNAMHRLLADRWMPLYSMVTFSRLPYQRCIQDRRWQDDLIDRAIKAVVLVVGVLALIAITKLFDSRDGSLNPRHIDN